MTLRDAIRNAPILTFAVLGAMGWLLVGLRGIATAFDWLAFGTGFVGQNAIGGVLGVVVTTVVFLLLVVLFAELPESDPAPDP